MQININPPVLEQLIDLLQSCFSVEEVRTAIEPLMEQLFPNEAGAIYIMSSSKNLLEAIATWGSLPLSSDPIFTPNECLALKRGQAHLAEDTHHCLLCQHIRKNSLSVETLCVPMMAYGEPVGVLSITSHKRGKIAGIRELAEKVAKYTGLALVNLKLRETIKNQSFRDPLTKLYHRRYLEESLERELHKSKHHPQSVGIILLEVDHFEHLNNSLDQAANDFLLREIGLFLPQKIRASDIACRYGSQQFLLLLPDVPLTVTQNRAEQLRQAIEQLSVEYRGKLVGSVSISCGVASFPENGTTAKEIIQAAQTALNQSQELRMLHI
ncbi:MULTISPECIES: diguanylate cyclase [unclassified Coleofasciculus]|uniref:sensor domain-containing diguanylate cyclase n=1 Tax=unclassified Coleofasciculus TaxID=2692782 RepID=UPI0018816125|nr:MULTISPECIES: diguanylate cyclase [unclassified Coleofasciculus]MBE9125947.1 diguanylate cyclase [Coleofasciculus sp. LEGE 07081]MBE9149319.1 diguanylate cyclase [Coleofasciculus sp. LEGE 07092]